MIEAVKLQPEVNARIAAIRKSRVVDGNLPPTPADWRDVLQRNWPAVWRDKDAPNLMHDGWMDLALALSVSLAQVATGAHVTLAEVDYLTGGLELKVRHDGSDRMYALVDAFELASLRLCQHCGRLGMQVQVNPMLVQISCISCRDNSAG